MGDIEKVGAVLGCMADLVGAVGAIYREGELLKQQDANRKAWRMRALRHLGAQHRKKPGNPRFKGSRGTRLRIFIAHQNDQMDDFPDLMFMDRVIDGELKAIHRRLL